MRRACVVLGATAVAASAAIATSLAAPQAATVVTFASSQTIPASGGLPPDGKASVALNAARGDHEGAWIVARGGGKVAASVGRGSLGPLEVNVAWGHFVRFGSRLVPDALEPWDGTERAVEQPNQPLYVRVTVPRTTTPGTYTGTIDVTVQGTTTSVPVSVRVFPFTLPVQGLPTSFHVSPPIYLNTVARLYGLESNEARKATNRSLFSFPVGLRALAVVVGVRRAEVQGGL